MSLYVCVGVYILYIEATAAAMEWREGGKVQHCLFLLSIISYYFVVFVLFVQLYY